MSVWLPSCSTCIQWQRQPPQKSQGESRHFSKAEGKALPKDYWREYPLWAQPDNHLDSFGSDATGWCLRAIYSANTTSAAWCPTQVLAPDTWEASCSRATPHLQVPFHSMAQAPSLCTPQPWHLYCSAEVLLSVIHRVATLKTYKTSSKVELTALPSLVLENGTGHVLHNTSKIAFKPSNSYQSLIFHHIPPSKLIPAFRSLCLRTTYPFPTHPDQPLHSELTPNPSPNTLLLPDHSSQPFILLTQFLVSNLQIATAPQSDRNLVKPA